MSRLWTPTSSAAVEQPPGARPPPVCPAGSLLLFFSSRVRLRAAFRLVAFLCVSGLPAVSPAGGCGFVYVVQRLRVQREEDLEIEGFAVACQLCETCMWLFQSQPPSCIQFVPSLVISTLLILQDFLFSLKKTCWCMFSCCWASWGMEPPTQSLGQKECCRDDVFLKTNLDVSIWFPQQKAYGIFFKLDFGLLQKKLCGKHTFKILAHFVQQDDLHRSTPLLWFSKHEMREQDVQEKIRTHYYNNLEHNSWWSCLSGESIGSKNTTQTEMKNLFCRLKLKYCCLLLGFFGWPHIRGQWLYFRLSSQSPLHFILSWMGWVQGSVQAGPILFTKTWEDSVGAFPPVESNRVTLIWLPSLAVLSCTWDGPPLQWGHIIPALPPSCSDIAWFQPTCHDPVSPRK